MTSGNDDNRFEERLKEAKTRSFLQPLFRAARLLDALGMARKPSRAGLRVRPAHRALLPHIGLQGSRPSAIAEALGITPQAVAQLVRDMEAMGMVERVPDPSDGRAKLVRFTHVGRQDILDGFEILAGIEAEVVALLGDRDGAELKRLLEALERIAENLS